MKKISNISGGFEPVNPHLKYGPELDIASECVIAVKN